MQNILVAVAKESSAQTLVEHAARFAAAFGAKLWLIHIAPPDPDFVGFDVGPQSVRDQEAAEMREEHRFVQTFARQLTARDIKAEGLLIQGAMVETLLEEAQKLACEMIVVGSHQHSTLANLFSESTSSSLFRKSKIPLLVVPLEDA
ncbi:Nucleotide-binding universal stress protein, UspA family [Catalinimonas alkaloidigena]|uniref:Universal stress protein n=1 Tax=Catalinimonas alkaloidigena TaxID=1075417 RepID=A0A1G9DT75_9BACT|nr:universal stress protein [Catalinimonas alkaloidigena]SDK67049.1 Nucleotide-binding universal stress protein, UspA family [Catalinimonas alkaloidigena]